MNKWEIEFITPQLKAIKFSNFLHFLILQSYKFLYTSYWQCFEIHSFHCNWSTVFKILKNCLASVSKTYWSWTGWTDVPSWSSLWWESFNMWNQAIRMHDIYKKAINKCKMLYIRNVQNHMQILQVKLHWYEYIRKQPNRVVWVSVASSSTAWQKQQSGGQSYSPSMTHSE